MDVIAIDASSNNDMSSNWSNSSLRLARRISYALTETEVVKIKSLGGAAYLEQQLAYDSINDSVVETFVASHFPNLKLSGAQISALSDQYPAQEDLIQSTIYRAAFSKRQLYHRMVEFWTDHFNIHLEKVGVAEKLPDDRDVIRMYALGSFPDLLWASAHSPAMLDYLDNDSSNNSAPNQNYARELMELHTLGVTRGYTQSDVENVARCFTGWTVHYEDPNASNYLTFKYDPDMHDDSDKVVLGVKIPAGGGISDGETVLRLLASHPSTANFISRKLILFFMGVEPSSAYLSSVANTYLSTKGDIRSIIRAIFQADVSATPAKFKRPFHLAVGLLRQTYLQGNSDMSSIQYGVLQSLGQVPFDWAPPNGYPDKIGYWSGSMLDRWNFGFDIAGGGVLNAGFDVNGFVSGRLRGRMGPGPIITVLDRSFTYGEMSPKSARTCRHFWGQRL